VKFPSWTRPRIALAGIALAGLALGSCVAVPVAAAQATAAAPAEPATPQGPSITITPVSPGGTSSANAVMSIAPVTTTSTAMRWAELTALVVLIGLIIYRLAILPAAQWSDELTAQATDRALRFARAVLLLFAIATLTRAFAQADQLPVSIPSRVDALITLVMKTQWGHAWVIGAAGAVAAMLGLIIAPAAASGWAVAGLGVIAMCLSEALTGRAGSAPHVPAAVAADVAHVLGAGGWLGGLFAVLLCGLPVVRGVRASDSIAATSQLMHAYHDSAMESLIIILAAGLISVWARLAHLSSLWTSGYGRTLLVKLGLVVLVLILEFYIRRRVAPLGWGEATRRRFRRLATTELLIGAIVIAAAAVLVGIPLPSR
jgi:copper transport protein